MPQDWKNVDLTTEGDACIIDPLTFAGLLLEIDCNIPEIDEAAVRRQFAEDLERIADDARGVFEANLKNIVRHARKERKAT